ncbi:DUF1150 family protein [Amaricoccus solimangrovi]|uniref:DUF1150 family protein n=1 Tax=Amaricoccus solimangrovi TaxID=2589815 RepID=A0A501WTA8_9RHOB|nr:DUF1150 family protein [Amaricoccus solimangrovi]TPE51334.1 DUF1150 family protein [Amaricoccus solimangrovi]
MTDFPSLTDDSPNRIVYVRSVKTSELPESIQAQAPGLDHVYSINAPDGSVLALVSDRQQAFVVARQNELSPVSVH